MGLTIHYTLKSSAANADQARRLVEEMRRLALDLPFAAVDDEIIDCDGAKCRAGRSDEDDEDGRAWLLTQASQSIPCPWNEQNSGRVFPERVIAFETLPGPGCEPANLGLCRYPATIDWEYRVADDRRFWSTTRRDG